MHPRTWLGTKALSGAPALKSACQIKFVISNATVQINWILMKLGTQFSLRSYTLNKKRV